MRNIGQCKCGNDIKVDDLVADGDGFLAYQCPDCMQIFYSYDEHRNVAKPDACPQLADVRARIDMMIMPDITHGAVPGDAELGRVRSFTTGYNKAIRDILNMMSEHFI